MASDDSPLHKSSIPPEVMPFYLEVGDLAGVWSRGTNWTTDLRGVPSAFDRNLLEGYLLSSPDKEFDGESLRSYKSLRAYQLFEKRHVHDIQFCPQWPWKDEVATEESPLCFLHCKCFPSQDTTKQPYRVVVCLDMRTGVPYGAHCRCVSGLGEACTHVAGLLFALEDFVSRGFHTLPDGQSTTEVLCAWSAPKSRRVEARPLQTVPITKAVTGGRKETTKWDRELNFSNYDPREEKHRKPGIESLLNVSHRLVERGASDCNFARFLTHKRKRSHSESETVQIFQPTQPTCLPELACDEDIPISSVIDAEIMGTVDKQGRDVLVSERQSKLFSAAGVLPVSDTETVNNLSEHGRRVELRLSIAERNELESSTHTQATSDIWHAEHVGHITASVSHAAMTGSKSKTPDRLVAKIMKYQCTDKPLHFDDPRQHGIQLEPVA